MKNQLKINGNISGVKKYFLQRLEALYDVPSRSFADPEIIDTVTEISAATGKEISVSISRGGIVTDISVGGASEVSVAAGNTRFREGGLNGVRTVHTHPGGAGELSDLDFSALAKCRFDAMAAVGIDGAGNITGASVAYLTPAGTEVVKKEPLRGAVGGAAISAFLQDESLLLKITENVRALKNSAPVTFENKTDKERVLLVGVAYGTGSGIGPESSLEELKSLARTAGADVAGSVLQHKSMPDRATMVGQGKLEEIKRACQIQNIGTVIFDNELSGVQIKNLEDALNLKVIDRSMLILDIFAGRATSAEGKLQVELAQLKYSLPRLIGFGAQMDKMRSGIGMRGPGEKKLEVDRRIIKDKVLDLERRIATLQKERDTRRSRRLTSFVPTAAIVGYTNSGKSTLMNLLSKSGVLAEDKLFATLDPITRKVSVEGVYRNDGKNPAYFLLTDTVGFINRLPHEFIDAFSSTLEEAKYADLLIHVMDISDPNLAMHYAVVTEVLNKIGAGGKPVITAYNKIDKLGEAGRVKDEKLPVEENFVKISALTGEGIEELKTKIIESFS